MAFNKRLWKGRQGTGLNKFSINGATPVTVINQPDSVTEQGDALSAGNLNDLEDRIYDAFEDIADGTQVVGKATADASGNVITTTYETKADASDLKDAIQGNTARIENLEQEHGGYVPVQYRGTNAVPTGKAKYGLVESIVGKSRAWNQLSVAIGTHYQNDVHVIKNADGSVTLDGTASAGGSLASHNTIPVIAGHAYLIYMIGDANKAQIFSDINSNHTTTGEIIVANGSGNGAANLRTANGTQFNNDVYYVLTRDLTLIFPEGVPSTVAECVQKCPDLLKYDAYGYSLPSTTVSGVKSIGKNKCDNIFEGGGINPSGQNEVNNDAFRTKNYLEIASLTDYYLSLNLGGFLYLRWFDADKNLIYATGGLNPISRTFTSPPNAKYLRFYCYLANSGWGINIPTAKAMLSVGTTAQTYSDYMTDTLSLPSSVTLRSAGSVADTDELNVEVLVDGVKVNRRRQTFRCSDVLDLSTLNWSGSSGVYYTSELGSLMKLPASNAEKAYLICDNPSYTIKSVNADSGVAGSGDLTVRSTGELVIRSNSSPTGHIVYVIKEETVTLLEPIENNTILTEGGGTINTIQTQTPVIDNSLDVGYLAL